MPELTEEQKKKLKRIQEGYKGEETSSEEPKENGLNSIFESIKKKVQEMSSGEEKPEPTPTPQPKRVMEDDEAEPGEMSPKEKLRRISAPFKKSK